MSSTQGIDDSIAVLQNRLHAQAEQSVKHWFENYLKGAICYYGVKTPQVRQIVARWRKDLKLDTLLVQQQLALACRLISCIHAEEKFAGTLYIQRYLLDKLTTDNLITTSADMYRKGYFFDWSSADWYTVRVLSPLVAREPGSIASLKTWLDAKNLWQRRAVVVSLRAVVKQADYHDDIAQVIAHLVTDSSRFIQTGIGWVISDLSRIFPQKAAAIVETHFDCLIREVIDRHTKYLPDYRLYKKRKRNT